MGITKTIFRHIACRYILSLTFIAIISNLSSCRNEHPKKNNPDTIKKDTTPRETSVGPVKIFPPPELGFKVVGYVKDSRDSAEVAEHKFAQCNVVVYSCAIIGKDNIVKVLHPENLASMVRRTHRYKNKLLLGTSGEPSVFAQVSKTEATRADCIKQIMKLAQQYHADGVDVDWEFPTIKTKTDEPFTLFMKQLGDSCHVNARYYLSCAVAPGVNRVKRAAAIKKELLTGPWVDWFNIMVYDAFSTVRPYVQHSKVAYKSYYYWLRVRKIKKEKWVLGIPIYGRPSGISQYGRVLSFKTILTEGGNPYSDSAIIKTQKPISKTDTTRQYTIYYDGLKTVKKKSRGALRYGGGIMFWELGYDVDNKYSLIKAALIAASANPPKTKNK